MPELMGYWFDEVGIAQARTRARFHDWVDLEAIWVKTVTPPKGAPFFSVSFEFTRVRRIHFGVKYDWRSRLPLTELRKILQLALAHSPSTVEVSPSARLVIAWGGNEDVELGRVNRWEDDGEKLIRAAQWRWARLELARAEIFLRRAVKRMPFDLRPRQVSLRLALDGVSPKRVRARAEEVLALAPGDREARSAIIVAGLLLGDAAAPAEAEAWCEREPEDRDMAALLAATHERAGRFAAAAAVVGRLRDRAVRSGLKDSLAASERRLARLATDEPFRKKHLRDLWWGKVTQWGWLAASVVVMGFVAYTRFNAQTRRTKPPEPVAQARQNILVHPLQEKAAKGDVEAMMTLATDYEFGLLGLPKNATAAYGLRVRAAEAGHVPAMQLVGVALRDGTGVAKDVITASAWWEKGAAAGDRLSARYLGDLFAAGREVPRDPAGAFSWYQRGAELGDMYSRRQVAWLQERGEGTERDFAAARESFTVLAGEGDAYSIFRLGLMCELGEGMEKNPTEAARWYALAAEKKYAAALRNLGTLYLNGRGVERDEKRAADLYRQAADLKDQGAQLAWASLLWRGLGVDRDPVQAKAQTEALVRAGYAPARGLLGEIAMADGTSAGLAQAREMFAGAGSDAETATISPRTAWEATRRGLLCLEGLGGPRDLPAARTALQRAAAAGEPIAAIYLAGMAMGYGGEGSSPDPAAARAALLQIPEAKRGQVWMRRAFAWLDEGKDFAAGLAGAEKEEALPSVPLAAEVEDEAPADRQPIVVYQRRPQYPLSMRYLGLTGEVLVDFLVTPTGEIGNPFVVRSTHAAFEPAAVAAVTDWRFKPGRARGGAVATHMQVPIVFSLNEDPPKAKGAATSPQPEKAR